MFYKVSYNQGFCSLLGFGVVLKKKSQYLADRAGEGTEKVKSTFRLKVNGGEIVVLPFFFCLT